MTTCSHCGAPIGDMQYFCSNCGATIDNSVYQQQDAASFSEKGAESVRFAAEAAKARVASGQSEKRKAFAFGRERKEQRFTSWYNPDEELSNNAYCGWLGGTVLYGLIVNLIICFIVDRNIEAVFRFLTIEKFLIFIGVYIASCFAGTLIANKSTSPIVSFIGYNMVVLPLGFLVSLSVYAYGGVDSPVVTQAVLITVIITCIMTALSIVKPELFQSLGKVLLIGLIALVVVSVISIFTHKDYIIWTYIGAGLFSLYIGYDMYRAMQYPKTKDNAIDCALDIYLDVINLFLKVLRILASSNSKRR